MKPKIFVTRKLPEPALLKLEEVFELIINNEDRSLSKDELATGIKNCDVLLCLLTDTIDEELIKLNPNLKGIANYAVGFNNIDVKTATKLKIPVSNTPGVLTQTTADLTWTLIMSASRRIVEADDFIRKGKFKGWEPMLFLGQDIYQKTLGIIGVGRIGTAVAERASGFKMNILYFDEFNNEHLEKNLSAQKVELEYLLKNSDIITLHIPLTEKTRHLIGENEIAMMKSTAIIINTSRGAVIDEIALCKALTGKRIFAAGLDVYENEPEITDGLKKLKNTVLLPHIGSASIETRTAMGILSAENAIAMIKGKQPPNIVNPDIYK